MPRIELIDVPLHGPNDPYHFEFDNVPLKALMTRQGLINNAVDNIVDDFRDAIGTQGSVSNRLSQSINPDGSLKVQSIDDALHSMDDHTDSTSFVRMSKAESDKLTLIDAEANDITLQIDDGTSQVNLTSGEVIFQSTSSVDVELEAPNIVKFNLGFDTAAAHQHHYGLDPVHDNLVTPDFINYKVNSIPSVFVSGSLRVFINGTRIFSDEEVYAAGALPDDPWTLLKFTPVPASGTFALSAAISDEDVIRIDFNLLLV